MNQDWVIDGVLDLDAAASARREAQGGEFGVRKGGEFYPLPRELPIDVFAPFAALSQDLALLVQDSWTTIRGNTSAAEKERAGEMILASLIANPALPTQVIHAVKAALGRLLCTEERLPGDDVHADDCGATRFARARLTDKDLRLLLPGLLAMYGVSLGEVLPPTSGSAGSGGTSKRTSRRGTGSTRGASGGARARRGSSVPAGSSPS